jgi:L-serine dehydratase
MKDAIKRGLDTEGTLPGILKLARRAPSHYIKAKNSRGFLQRMQLIATYALAVSEENASGGMVVTAPTCGSCGILPAVLYSLQKRYKIKDQKIYHALATAGIIGAVVKRNASVSGADVGCQGEVGVACAMAAGAATQLLGGTIREIEYAAEMGLEHHLGLTCDPVAGLVQIPCIERNAVGAMRAIECASIALLSDGRHRVSFDQVVQTMLETGHDLQSKYKETAQGGLAKRNFKRVNFD